MIELTKFLAVPFYPLGLVLLLLLVAIVVVARGKRRSGLLLIVLSTGVLVFFSLPLVAHVLVGSLESQYSQQLTYPPSTAIVLLGGAEVPRMPPRIYDETNVFGDRLTHAARLFKQGFAPRIITSGGKLRFIQDFPGSEADVSFRLLTGVFGIDSASIICERRARNTYENGVFVKKILDSLKLPERVILVTSAVHMPRSVRIFRKLGITVYPAPANYFEDSAFQSRIIEFIPSVDALSRSTMAIHEIYGMISYRLIGWM